jgi:hypothetical protein
VKTWENQYHDLMERNSANRDRGNARDGGINSPYCIQEIRKHELAFPFSLY